MKRKQTKYKQFFEQTLAFCSEYIKMEEDLSDEYAQFGWFADNRFSKRCLDNANAVRHILQFMLRLQNENKT